MVVPSSNSKTFESLIYYLSPFYATGERSFSILILYVAVSYIKITVLSMIIKALLGINFKEKQPLNLKFTPKLIEN